MNLETMKKRIDILSKDLYLHQSDKKKYAENLKNKYSLNIKDASARLEQIEKKQDHIRKKIKGLQEESEQLLQDIKDAIS